MIIMDKFGTNLEPIVVPAPAEPVPAAEIETQQTDLPKAAAKEATPASLQTPAKPQVPAVFLVHSQTLTEVEVGKIRPNPWQPRKMFKEEYLRELADSIKEHGILQPLVVIAMPDGFFQLIVGERRLRAANMAGLSKVPVIIRDAMEEQQKLELALIENIQRHNLDPIEEAQAYQQLIDQYKLTQEEVARKVGKGRPTVTNMLRLLNLPLKIQRAVAEGVIQEGHARPILGLPGMEKQLAMFEEIVRDSLTVRQVEDRIRQIMERPRQIKAPRSNSDPDDLAIESQLRGKLGTKVKVQKSGQTRKILIEFFSEEELNSFMEKMSQLK